MTVTSLMRPNNGQRGMLRTVGFSSEARSYGTLRLLLGILDRNCTQG